jgi:hypothetical protein
MVTSPARASCHSHTKGAKPKSTNGGSGRARMGYHAARKLGGEPWLQSVTRFPQLARPAHPNISHNSCNVNNNLASNWKCDTKPGRRTRDRGETGAASTGLGFRQRGDFLYKCVLFWAHQTRQSQECVQLETMSNILSQGKVETRLNYRGHEPWLQ